MWFRAEALVIVSSRPVSIYRGGGDSQKHRMWLSFLKKKNFLLRYLATFDSTSSNLIGRAQHVYL